MRTVRLGHSDLTVSRMGLGCMGMSEYYGRADDDESIATMRRAVELGVTFFDTADVYGQGANERLVKRGLVDAGLRDKVVIATKFGQVRDDTGALKGVNGRPDYIREACDRSLSRLGIQRIDLYYQHRIDPATPIEETVGALADLVREGKIRAIGLSEASVSTLRRACAVHPIAALQTEYSIWTRDVEKEHLAACRELGVGFVAYSPIGRGFLTGRFASPESMDADDFRRGNPRFSEPNFRKNLRIVDALREIAREKDASPGQVALAWVMAQGDDIVPIPGTTRRKHLEEDVAAARLVLTQEDMKFLNAIGPAAGQRYAEAGMKFVNV